MLLGIIVDGLIKESEYEMQRKLLQDSLEAFVAPAVDAALHAGELLECLGLIWKKATLEKRHRLLTQMLTASMLTPKQSQHSRLASKACTL